MVYEVPVGFYFPSNEAMYCYICGRRRVAVARYRTICLVRIETSQVDECQIRYGLQIGADAGQLVSTIRTHAPLQTGQGRVSGGISVPPGIPYPLQLFLSFSLKIKVGIKVIQMLKSLIDLEGNVTSVWEAM